MTNVTKILLSLIVASIVSPTNISVAQAITIIEGSYEFESLDSALSRTGLENYNGMISELNNGPETLSISEKFTDCGLDLKGCGATTAARWGNTAVTPTANNTTIATGNNAGGTTHISDATALLLIILGLIGLSRLRGRPMD